MGGNKELSERMISVLLRIYRYESDQYPLENEKMGTINSLCGRSFLNIGWDTTVSQPISYAVLTRKGREKAVELIKELG